MPFGASLLPSTAGSQPSASSRSSERPVQQRDSSGRHMVLGAAKKKLLSDAEQDRQATARMEQLTLQRTLLLERDAAVAERAVDHALKAILPREMVDTAVTQQHHTNINNNNSRALMIASSQSSRAIPHSPRLHSPNAPPATSRERGTASPHMGALMLTTQQQRPPPSRQTFSRSGDATSSSRALVVVAPSPSPPQVTSSSPLQQSARKRGGEAGKSEFVSFEASGFQSLIAWANVSFDEAVQACRGPHESTAPSSFQPTLAMQSTPDTFLTKSCCFILDELLMNVNEHVRGLWHKMRAEIFGAIFCVHDSSSSAASRSKEAPPAASEDEPKITLKTPFRSMCAAKPTWEERFQAAEQQCSELRSTISQLEQRIDMQPAIIDASLNVQRRELLQMYFRGWRITLQREKRREAAIEAFVLRRHNQPRLQRSFLRWRRISVASKLRRVTETRSNDVMAAAKTSQEQQAKLRMVEEQLAKESRVLRMELAHEGEVRSHLIEGHAIELLELQSMHRSKDDIIVSLEKAARRWERLSKSFRPVERTPPPPTVVKASVALKALEDQMLQKCSRELTSEARKSLESLLVTWVNEELASAGSRLKPIANVTIDLRDGEVYFALARILRKDVISTTSHDAVGELDIYSSLMALMYANTAQGLFPPLLVHCPFYQRFFTPETFLQSSHPSSGLWILSSLLVAKALQTGTTMFLPARPLEQLDSAVVPVDEVVLMAGVPVDKDLSSGERRRWQPFNSFRRSGSQHRMSKAASQGDMRLSSQRLNSFRSPFTPNDDDEWRDNSSDEEAFFGPVRQQGQGVTLTPDGNVGGVRRSRQGNSDSDSDDDGSDDDEDDEDDDDARSELVDEDGARRPTESNFNDAARAGSRQDDPRPKHEGNLLSGDFQSASSSYFKRNDNMTTEQQQHQQEEEGNRRKSKREQRRHLPLCGPVFRDLSMRELVTMLRRGGKVQRRWVGIARVLMSVVVRFHVLHFEFGQRGGGSRATLTLSSEGNSRRTTQSPETISLGRLNSRMNGVPHNGSATNNGSFIARSPSMGRNFLNLESSGDGFGPRFGSQMMMHPQQSVALPPVPPLPSAFRQRGKSSTAAPVPLSSEGSTAVAVSDSLGDGHEAHHPVHEGRRRTSVRFE